MGGKIATIINPKITVIIGDLLYALPNPKRIKNLIEKDYAKDISLNYVAENVNLTPAYVSYIFKKETGQTLVKYIRMAP